MIRTLLATTALAAVLVLPTLAQDTSSSIMDSSSMTESSAMDSSMMSSEMPMDTSSSAMDAMSSEMPMDMSSMEPAAPFDITAGYTRVDSDRLATRVIGQPVYDGTAADANNLGNINDLVLDANGNIAAIVVGVGGFLGLGEKQVAVDYSALQWVVAADNTERFVIETTVDQLKAAPDFVTTEDQPGDASSAMDMSSSAAM